MITVSETAARLGQALPGAAREKAVANYFGGERTFYDGPQASTGSVADAMADHDHAHFACHGTVDAAHPTRSGLRLYDNVLTIGTLSRLQRQPGGLAFLSACDTAAGSSRHPDEAITMAAAMHMAGYQHVIATLWYILDSISPAVASSVYAALSTPDGRLNLGEAASALRAVARSLRDAGYPAALWAPYVHSGP
jgi:CHAT domain-containing protein